MAFELFGFWRIAMNRDIRCFALAVTGVFLAASLASAQNRFGGMGGMGGTSGFGTSAFGSGGGFGNSTFGGGMGNSAFGRSGFGGSGGFGNMGFGQSAFGRGGGMGSMGFGGGGFGSTGFGGQGMFGGGMGGQSFVGRDGGDMQAIMGQMGRAGTQFFNTMNRNMTNRNRNRQQQPQMEENERPPVRIRLEVGFAAPQPAPSATAAMLNARLERLAVDHSIGQTQISVEGDTVVLRGTVESESQRRVLERFVLLEPGVMQVRNELVVAAPVVEELPTAEPLPATGN
jgi:hypothetical protein